MYHSGMGVGCSCIYKYNQCALHYSREADTLFPRLELEVERKDESEGGKEGQHGGGEKEYEGERQHERRACFRIYTAYP